VVEGQFTHRRTIEERRCLAAAGFVCDQGRALLAAEFGEHLA
jgi:hypothetical protein